MKTAIERVHDSAVKFLVPLTLEELYSIIVHEAMRLVKAKYGSIFLAENGKLVRVYASSPLLYKVNPRRKGLTYQVYKTNQPMVLTSEKMEKIHPKLKVLQVCSDIMIPLSYKNQSIGVLTVLTPREEELDVEKINTIKLFGSMTTLAIKKTQLLAETKKALETRDLFVSMAAHELRTPMTTIYGYAQLLKQKTADKNTIEAKWIKELHMEVLRLSLLVNDLLEINRIRAGHSQYILKQCALKEVIEKAIRNFKFNYPHREIIFKDYLANSKSEVIGDCDKLFQVIVNLLDNAAKFSERKTSIKVNLFFKKPRFRIDIEDKGRGISKKDIPRVFESFYRGSGTATATEGMGLGLYLARNIIEKHNGAIKIHSRINKGTRVEILLPKPKL